MLIDQVNSAGALPVLEQTMRLAGQRQKLIAHNIANISTPDFRPLDVSIDDFRSVLRDAVHQRRRETGGMHGQLKLESTTELKFGRRGELALNPKTPQGNILFQDRNNRDLERMMQDLAENAAVFRTAGELMRSQMDQLRRAMSERAG